MAGPMNPYDEVQPPRQGMSGTTKVLLGFGIGCGLLLLLCCGVFGLGGVYVAQLAKKSVTEDAGKIREITDEVVSIKLPESLTPKYAVDMPIPIFGGRLMCGAFYQGATDDEFVGLGEFGQQMAGGGDFEEQLRQSMRENQPGDHEELDVKESDTIETKVNDEDAKFKLVRGDAPKTKQEYWEVTGAFHGNGGPAILILRLRTANYDKQQVLDIVNSMK